MDNESNTDLNRNLSPLNVWALSFGSAVGWGAFVMPGTTFLPIAGPVGTALGMAVGGVVMLIIGYNYHYMMNRIGDAGGTYSYAKRILGYDHGFLSAWFLVLVYIAITWANATALPIIFRNFLGDAFQFGFLYRIAGYEVYLGEALLSLSALWIFELACIRGGRLAARIQTAAALILFFGVLAGFVAAVSGGVLSVEPEFSPRGSSISAVIGIAVLAPWAFVGFESVSHSAEEFNFSLKKSFAIIFVAVAAAALVYAFLALIAVAVVPSGYWSWVEYIADLRNLSGLEGLPTFFAVNELLGGAGLVLLAVTVVAAVVTGLIGNSLAASRLIFALTRDGILPEWFAKLSPRKAPVHALLFLMALSLPIPFLGRTAIGWIIDVNTVGATIAYAYTSAVAFRLARESGARLAKVTGAAGFVLSIFFFLYFMIPNFWAVDAMSNESYLILICWSILGFVFFRLIFGRDTARRFGRSTVVWIVLLFLIFFTSTMWLRETTHDTTRAVLNNLSGYYSDELREHGVSLDARGKVDSEYYLERQMDFVSATLTNSNLLQMALILVALFIMFNVYNLMMLREKEMEVQKVEAEGRGRAEQQGQIRLPLQHEPRHPHAHERHYRLHHAD